MSISPETLRYESNERMMLEKQIRGTETAPLSDRKDAQHKFYLAMLEEPFLVADRIRWIFQGNYGWGAMRRADEILMRPRSNREAQLTQLVGALEWGCPPRETNAAWNKLDQRAKTALDQAIRKVLDEYKDTFNGEPRSSVIRENPGSGPVKYEVLVGNIGNVYSGNGTEARRVFADYVKQSKSGYGRAAGEDVTIMRDGEPWKEHQGEQSIRENPGIEIQPGDLVTIMSPQGQYHTGRVVMRSSHPDSWVLNMGGRHGTPGIATEGVNIVRVRKGRARGFNAIQRNPSGDAEVPQVSSASRATSQRMSAKRWRRDPFEATKRKIARQTLAMPDAFDGLMGGPTKAEAREILGKGYEARKDVVKNPGDSV